MTNSKSIGTWSSRVDSVKLAPIWQLVTFPADPVYCRCTPTEYFPCFRKPVPSIIQASIFPLPVIADSAKRVVSALTSWPFHFRHAQEMQKPLMGCVCALRACTGPRCDGLRALALRVRQETHRIGREGRPPLLVAEHVADAPELRLEPVHRLGVHAVHDPSIDHQMTERAWTSQRLNTSHRTTQI